MRIINRILPKTHNLYISSDKHYGTTLQHKKGIKKFVNAVDKDPIGYWVDLGDIAEGIAVDDKRYCIYTTDIDKPTTIRQYEGYLEDHKKIFDKLLVILEGNHDWKIGAKTGSLVKSFLCHEIGREIGVLSEDLYGTYECKLVIRDKKDNLQYKSFFSHGFGSINSAADDPVRRQSNMYLSLKRKLHRKAADCAIMGMGHTHKLLVKPPIEELYLTDDGRHIKEQYTKSNQTDEYINPDLRWYVNSGSFYKLYQDGVSGYASRAGYDPNELGYLKVIVCNSQIKDIKRIVL